MGRDKSLIGPSRGYNFLLSVDIHLRPKGRFCFFKKKNTIKIMLTKAQKQTAITEGVSDLKTSQSIVFADFTGIPNSDLRALRITLKEKGAKFQVIKKRLLKIILKEVGVDYDPTEFDAQAGSIISQNPIFDMASSIQKFSKDLSKSKKIFKILGAIDLQTKKAITKEEFERIAKLPTREILLAQIAIVLQMPMQKLAIALNSRKEQLTNTQ